MAERERENIIEELAREMAEKLCTGRVKRATLVVE